MAIEKVDVVVTIDVIVNDGDDDAMTLVGALLGSKAEVLVAGFGFDGKLTRVAKEGRV